MRETPSGLVLVENTRSAPIPPSPPGAFSARALDTSSDHQRRLATAGSNAWQDEGWTYFDEIEEVKFAAGFRGALMRRLIMFAGVVTQPGQPPIPIEEAQPSDMPADIAAAAANELARLGTLDQQAELLGSWGAIATVSGESYLIGQEAQLEDTGERWRLFSESNVVRGTNGDTVAIRTRPGAPPEQLSIDDAKVRVWRPHARWPDLADANMRSVLGTAEELLIYARQMRAVGKSRNPAGLLYIANEIGDQPTTDGKPTAMEIRMVESQVTAITEDAAPSAVVPHIIRGPAAFGTGQRQVPAKDAIFKIDLDRKIDEKAVERIEFLVKRLAHGLDVPVEILTGIADINHWGAWQIEETTYKAHIEPDALTFAGAVTTEVLRPGLLDLFGPSAIPWIRKVVVGLNPAALVVRPNRAKDALDAFDRWAISFNALRDHLNFGEDEAPDEAEMLARLTLTRSIGAATLTGPMLEETGIMPNAIAGMAEVAEAQNVAPADGGSGDDQGPAAATGDPSTPVDDEPATAARGIAGAFGPSDADLARARLRALTPAPLAAAIEPRPVPRGTMAARSAMAPALGERLASIDRQLLDRLVISSGDALTAALRVIGNRLRTQAQGDPAAAAAVKGVAADQVAAALLAAGLPVPDIEPLASDQFGDLADRWDLWVAGAFAATADTLTRAVPDGEDGVADRVADEATAGQEARSTAGRALLIGSLIGLAVSRTLDPTSITPEEGEAAGLVVVPPGVVRNALATTGGVTNPGAQPHGLAGEIGPGQTVGEVATGPQTARALRTAGYSVSGWTWHTGLPVKPFHPHTALGGVAFSSWDDAQLINDQPWPPFSHYFPGDHINCQCSAALTVAPITEG